MAQETSIKVKIDDNEALQALREMAALVGQISEGLGGLQVPPDAVPSAPTAPSAPSAPSAPTKSKEEQEAEKLKEERKRIFLAETRATIESLTSPQTMSALTSRFGQMIGNIGKALGGFTGALGTTAGETIGILGRSLAAREARLGDMINLEALETEMSGVIDTGDARGLATARETELARLGLDPTQARQFMLGVTGATGFRTTGEDLSTGRLTRLAAAERTGVSAQSLAGLAGVIAQNTGVAVGRSLDTSLALRNIAERQLDLRGSGVERFLGQLGGFVEGLTARGITALTAETARTLTGISAATGQRGQRPLQIMQGLSGVAQGAFGQIAGPMQEIAQMSVLADIMSRSTDIFSAMEEAEKLQADPGAIPSIISQTLGGGRTAASVLGAVPGIGTRDATKLLGLSGGSIETGDRLTPAQVSANLQLSGAQAEQTRQTIESLRDPRSTETFQKMIEVSASMERSTLKASENIDLLTKIVDLQVKLSQEITGAVNRVSKILDKLQRFL